MLCRVHQKCRPAVLAFVALLFSLSAVRADLFTCENGSQFYGQFAPDGSGATVQLNGQAITFKSAISASGARYISSGGFELWGKGNNFLFTPPGQAMTRCLRQPGRGEPINAPRNSAPAQKIKQSARIWHTQRFNGKVITTDCKDDCEEDIGIMLECSAPDKPVTITVPWASGEQGRKGALVPVQFEMDGKVLNYQGTTEYWGLVGYLPKLQLPLSDPLFASLARASRLTVHFTETPTPISMRGASRALTEFYSSCASLRPSNRPGMAQPPAVVPQGQRSASSSRDGLVWQYYENIAEGSAWLTFGIPETDATTVTMECRKNQPGTVKLTFIGAPAGLPAGVPVQLIMRLPDWSLKSFRAMVDQRGFVIVNSGLQENSLFAQLAGIDRKEIYILVNGQAAGKLQGYANSSQGQKFQSFCHQ